MGPDAHALWRRRQKTAEEEKKIDAGKDTGRSLKVVDGQGQRKEEGDGRLEWKSAVLPANLFPFALLLIFWWDAARSLAGTTSPPPSTRTSHDAYGRRRYPDPDGHHDPGRSLVFLLFFTITC